MAIAEATFGAVGNSHGLIAASPGAAKYTSLIVGRTDLPSTASGVSWSPFESGFSDNGVFFLSRTWPDTQAERGGMVFTHTLVAPWAEINVPDGLARLQAMLPAHMDRTRAPVDQPLARGQSPTPSPHVGRLLDLMLNAEPPTVWIGETGLCDALATLWPHLPPDLRTLITFRLSFGAENPAILPRFVVTPVTLAQRWTGKSILDPRTPGPAISNAAASLLNAASAQKIREYGDRFGVRPRSLDDWASLQQVSAMANAEGESVASLLMQIRFLVVLSPQADEGVGGKSNLTAAAAAALARAPAQQIAVMRNLKLADWPNADVLWHAVHEWSAAHAGIDGAGDAEGVWTHAVATAGVEPPWRDAVLTGFDDAAKTGDRAFWSAWWRRWCATPELIAPLFKRLSKQKKIEAAIVATAPDAIELNAADILINAAAAKGWLVLHAVVAVCSRPLEKAIQLQLAVDDDQQHPDGLVALLADRDGADRVAMALRHSDPRLVEIAGEAANREHALFAEFDIRSPTWRRILLRALQQDGQAWTGIGDLSGTREALSALLLDGTEFEDGFLDSVSDTDLADLCSVLGRELVWSKLPQSARKGFLDRTASAWLEQFASGTSDPPNLDHELRSIIVSTPIAVRFLKADGRAPETVLRFLEVFEDAPQEAALAWLDRLKNAGELLDAARAERLGHLLKQRHWTRAASALAALMHTDQGYALIPAVSFLRSMLQFAELQGLWVRGLIAANDDDVWSTFENVAAKLYPDGPNDSALWSRAGGDPSDLPFARTGRTKWHNTLRELRQGRHDIGAHELLSAMTEEHRHNTELQWLAKQKTLRNG